MAVCVKRKSMLDTGKTYFLTELSENTLQGKKPGRRLIASPLRVHQDAVAKENNDLQQEFFSKDMFRKSENTTHQPVIRHDCLHAKIWEG